MIETLKSRFQCMWFHCLILLGVSTSIRCSSVIWCAFCSSFLSLSLAVFRQFGGATPRFCHDDHAGQLTSQSGLLGRPTPTQPRVTSVGCLEKIIQNGDLTRWQGTCFCIDFFDFFPVRTTNFDPFWMFKLIVESKTQALPEGRAEDGWQRRMVFFCAFNDSNVPYRRGVHYGDANVCASFRYYSLFGKKTPWNTLFAQF